MSTFIQSKIKIYLFWARASIKIGLESEIYLRFKFK